MKRRLLVLPTIALLAVSSAILGAGPDTQWVGVLWTKGNVLIGDAKVSSGATVVPGDVITTGEGASAWLRFRSPASTVLMADTQVALFASNSSPSLALRHGTMVVEQMNVDPVQVTVPGAHVLVKGDATTGAECQMMAEGNAATITVKRGAAEVHGMGAPVLLHAGQYARVEAGPQGGTPTAGKISKEIPHGVIQRQGQTQEVPLTVNQQVNWNDEVRTLQAGRAQIMLLDGSFLNVGARSTLKILKHDPQAQQTEIELTLGKVQASVQKITTPGGKFELHTKSAIIGTVDTEWVAQSSGNSTTVCGVSGTTSVKSSDPNITKTVTLKANQCTTVVFGFAPTDPVYAPTEVANMLGQTAVTGGGAVGGGLSTAVLVGVGGAAGAGAGLIVGEVVVSAPPPSTVFLPVP